MSVNEAALIMLMQQFPARFQRALILERYIQHYGPLSEETGKKAKELIDEEAGG